MSLSWKQIANKYKIIDSQKKKLSWFLFKWGRILNIILQDIIMFNNNNWHFILYAIKVPQIAAEIIS